MGLFERLRRRKEQAKKLKAEQDHHAELRRKYHLPDNVVFSGRFDTSRYYGAAIKKDGEKIFLERFGELDRVVGIMEEAVNGEPDSEALAVAYDAVIAKLATMPRDEAAAYGAFMSTYGQSVVGRLGEQIKAAINEGTDWKDDTNAQEM